MESTGCFFSRSTSQPKDFKDAITENWQKVASDRGCSGSKKFEIPIPGGGFESSNDFNVSGLRYDPVAKGERITVSIYGSNFSSQIGMMINGSPLPPSLGVAQPFIRDDSSVASSVITDLQGEKVKGRFERVDSSQIVASFEMPATYEKTPTITLVAPGKAVEINSLDNIEINGIPNTKLKYTEWMFGTKPKIMDFVANEPQIFRKINGDMVAIITGTNLNNVAEVYVNGEKIGQKKITDISTDCTNSDDDCRFIKNDSYIKLVFAPPLEDKIQITLITNNRDETIKLAPITKPVDKPETPPKAQTNPAPTEDETKLKIVKYETSFIDKDTEDSPLYVAFHFYGIGFSNDLISSIGKIVEVKKAKETGGQDKMTILLTNPEPFIKIKLTKADNTFYTESELLNTRKPK
jgi:hypothetical protein